MANEEVIKLDKVPEGKERIAFELKVKLRVNWNYDIIDNTMIPTNYKANLFFENYEKPKDLYLVLNTYLDGCFEQLDGVVDLDFSIEEINIPQECKDSYDKFLKAHTESVKQKVKKEIEELENKAKQLKEKLKKL